MAPSGIATLRCSLSFSMILGTDVDWCATSRVVSYGPCSPVRLTPPPPSQNPRSAANQVLMFTDRHTRVEDYQALKQACTLLQLEPVFLDIERYPRVTCILYALAMRW